MTQTAKSRKQSELIKAATVARVSDKECKVLGYLVKSNSSDNYYQVTYNYKARCYECTCTAGRYHKVCCHKSAVKEVVQARREIQAAKEAEQRCAAPTLAGYDVVGAALVVFNQTVADHKIGNAYEQLAQTKCCPRCGESDLLYPRTGRCQWVPTYEQL